MDILIIIGLILFTLIVALVTWIGIPGTFIMSFVVLFCGWLTGFEVIGAHHIFTVFGVSILLEVVEFLMGGLAARYYGASTRSAIFAILGGIVGTIIGAGIFFPIGALLGLLIGSYLGAYLSEKIAGKPDAEAARAALGTVIGNVASKTLKSTTVVIIGIWLMVALT